jgi:hypothetical protein
MTNICRTLSLVTVVALVLTAAGQSWAQSAASYYEAGVNAFFAGRTDEAESRLSEAISYDPSDPRAYYFRAFALARQGRCAEARGDMMTGAQMEATSPRQAAIGSALERIQGPNRLMLEAIRRQARLEAGVASGVATGASQNAIVLPGEENTLRQRRVVPIDEFLRPGGPRTFTEPAPQVTNEIPPQAPAATMPAAKPAESTAAPAKQAQPAASNPFGDDSQPAGPKPPVTPPQAVPTPPTAPPATPPQNATETPPAATPPADSSDNPFNG